MCGVCPVPIQVAFVSMHLEALGFQGCRVNPQRPLLVGHQFMNVIISQPAADNEYPYGVTQSPPTL